MHTLGTLDPTLDRASTTNASQSKSSDPESLFGPALSHSFYIYRTISGAPSDRDTQQWSSTEVPVFPCLHLHRRGCYTISLLDHPHVGG